MDWSKRDVFSLIGPDTTSTKRYQVFRRWLSSHSRHFFRISLFSMSLMEIIAQNLVHFHLWTSIQTFPKSSAKGTPHGVVRGVPPKKLSETTSISSTGETESSTTDKPDGDTSEEWVLPLSISDKLTVENIEQIFESIRSVGSYRPKRIIAGLLDDDGSVVYYFIHDGLVKPRS